MNRKLFSVFFMVFVFLIVVCACGGGGGGSSSPSKVVTLSSISISPANAIVNGLGTEQFKATAIYSNGTSKDVTSQSTWGSSSQSIATISTSGLATCLAIGTTTISATYEKVSGTTTLSVTASTLWIWMSGSDVIDQLGNYGTEGTAASSNIPGARDGATSLTDSNGNFWLFGGCNYYVSPTIGNYFNDLWKYDGTNWTWISGSNTVNQVGIYGTQKAADPANVPGARHWSVSWIDSKGNLWIFGGWGYDSNGNIGFLNDLWKYDGTNWTWVSGSNIVNQEGIYGTEGTASPKNTPGARGYAASWIDAKGNFWIFGGSGYDSAGNYGYLNDLWEYDGNYWTWIGGYNTVNQVGIYGTRGRPSSSNIPGARNGTVSWIDSNGNFWLFGGWNGSYCFNDLWRYTRGSWTWVSGTNTGNQTGIYGTQGTAAATNVPGAREWAVSWIDSKGNLWFFGGFGYDSVGNTFVSLNDLWKYDGTNWTWVSGSNIGNQAGIYGTQGTPASSNIPGARNQAVSWTDAKGNFWLFGGGGYDSAGNFDRLNDLWVYTP